MVIALLLLSAAEPSSEALTLGRKLAETGTLASLLPLLQQKESEDLVVDHPELNAAEKDKLRATAQRIYESGRERLMRAEAQAYAKRLSIRDLRAAVEFQSSPAGRRTRAAVPGVIGDTMKSVGTMDFKGDVRAAYCKDTGKLCGK